MKLFSLYSLLFVATCTLNSHSNNFFSKVIIWGHPLHSHTHSYIHWGFYRAFKHLGHEVYWVKDQTELPDIDLHNALFITEGQVDRNIPQRLDCYYIVHNWDPQQYQDLFSHNRCIVLQVYTHDCLTLHAIEKIDDCIYCDMTQKMIFIPWATDLLPDEIEAIKQTAHLNRTHKKINWIGTIGNGYFGNMQEIVPFQQACIDNGIAFNHITNVSMEDNQQLIQSSYMAPAIQGAFQCEKGYIPCRIFKNISYGQWGITNNQTVYDLFKGKIVYNVNTSQLFYDAQHYINNASLDDLYALMDFVKNKHTYINRIETLLAFMEKALITKEN